MRGIADKSLAVMLDQGLAKKTQAKGHLCKPSCDEDSRKPRALICKPSRDEDSRKLRALQAGSPRTTGPRGGPSAWRTSGGNTPGGLAAALARVPLRS
jgi:hypothetical protein